MNSPTDRPSILVITASTREGRMGEPVTAWFKTFVDTRQDADYRFIDLRDWKFPYIDETGTVRDIEQSYAPADPRHAWKELISAADGFIVITPEYNHGYPAVLKSAFDALYAPWNNKPIAFVSYGGAAGGTRAVEQLRLVAIELQLAPIRNAVVIQWVRRNFGEDRQFKDPIPAKQAEALLDQLGWWVRVMRDGRRHHSVPGQEKK